MSFPGNTVSVSSSVAIACGSRSCVGMSRGVWSSAGSLDHRSALFRLADETLRETRRRLSDAVADVRICSGRA